MVRTDTPLTIIPRDPRTVWSESVQDFQNFVGPGPFRDLEFFLGPGPVPGFEIFLGLGPVQDFAGPSPVRDQPVLVRGSLSSRTDGNASTIPGL